MKKIVVTFSFIFLLPGCPSDKSSPDKEPLTIVVEADRSRLLEQEQELKRKFEELQQERERLRQQQEKLLNEKLQTATGDDSVQLIARVRQLLENQKNLLEKEKALEQERQQLAEKKEKLPAGTQSDTEQIARREAAIAEREAALAIREKQLAEREAALARREADFLALQSRLGAAQSTISQTVEKPVSAAMATKNYNQLMAEMHKRGILLDDLPPQAKEIISALEKARKTGQGAKMADLVEQLKIILNTVIIDSAFLERKFQRLASLVARKKLSEEVRSELVRLQRKATTLYSDGKFVQANQELNNIFSLLEQKTKGEKP